MTRRPGHARPPRQPTRLAIDVAADGVRSPVARADIAAIAAHVLRGERARDALLSVTLVSAPAIARLNRRHLGHARSTDVIALALSEGGRARGVLGDIYVCPAVARVHAKRYGVSVREEVLRLVVHGTLHVLGWDHPEGERRMTSAMWRRQEALLRAWKRRRRSA